jgi:hypothetical protein
MWSVRTEHDPLQFHKANVMQHLPMQSVPITTKVVSSNPVHGEVYSIQHYKVCQRLATGRWLSPGTLVSSTNKTDRHDIAEILLKVALNTINQPT